MTDASAPGCTTCVADRLVEDQEAARHSLNSEAQKLKQALATKDKLEVDLARATAEKAQLRAKVQDGAQTLLVQHQQACY